MSTKGLRCACKIYMGNLLAIACLLSALLLPVLSQHIQPAHVSCYTAHAPCLLTQTDPKQQNQQTHLRRPPVFPDDRPSSAVSTWSCGLQQHVWTRADTVIGCVARVSCVGIGCEFGGEGDWSVAVQVRRCDVQICMMQGMM